MQEVRLHTERLVLRKPDASDLVPYTLYCKSDRTRFVGGPFTDIQAFEKLAAMIGHWQLRGFGRFVVVHRATGRALGHVGAMQLSTEAMPELTWTLWAGEDEGQGYATEACEAYREHVRYELGLSALTAHIMQDNHSSRRLAERLGGVLNLEAQPPEYMAGTVTYDIAM